MISEWWKLKARIPSNYQIFEVDIDHCNVSCLTLPMICIVNAGIVQHVVIEAYTVNDKIDLKDDQINS